MQRQTIAKRITIPVQYIGRREYEVRSSRYALLAIIEADSLEDARKAAKGCFTGLVHVTEKR